MSNSVFEIVKTKLGVTSIKDSVTGEIMHNPVGPWDEANSLYIQQSRLTQKLQENRNEELVLFDVGLGAAANALAVLHCARNAENYRPLKMISFERDLTLLQFALKNADQFEHFKGFEGAIESILNSGLWSAKNIQWELRHGDFTRLIENEPNHAHLIYFDPYSAKKNTDMWNIPVFEKTYQKCSDTGATLYTYSRATPVRVALLNAGFYIGAGIATGAKDETTQAGIRLEDLDHPLGMEWLDKWGRSHQANAAGALPEDFEKIRLRVLNHPQFKKA